MMSRSGRFHPPAVSLYWPVDETFSGDIIPFLCWAVDRDFFQGVSFLFQRLMRGTDEGNHSLERRRLITGP
jgi:hypothetical protein